MNKGTMYFYIYEGRVYWGRYGNMATQRNTFSWIFRNKTVKLGRCYISGPNRFTITRSDPTGPWMLAISYNDGPIRIWPLVADQMYNVREAGSPFKIDFHETMRRDSRNAFRNRLNEYKGRYFLPIHKHARCV